MRPVKAPGGAGLSIGNALRSGGSFCNGEIDEVKIWRLNPRRVEDEFYAGRWTGRQPNAGGGSGARSRRRSGATRTAQSRSAALARRAQSTVSFAKPTLKGPETQSRLLRAAKEYNRLWRGGKVDSPEMVDVFVDLIGWLRIAGIAPEDNASSGGTDEFCSAGS